MDKTTALKIANEFVKDMNPNMWDSTENVNPEQIHLDTRIWEHRNIFPNVALWMNFENSENDDGEEVLVNIYTKLHTGAKFDSDGNSGYNTSGGMNGVGAKATNALSNLFSVASYRDGKVAYALFGEGNLMKYEVRKRDPKKFVGDDRWNPDYYLDYTNGLLTYYSTGCPVDNEYDGTTIQIFKAGE